MTATISKSRGYRNVCPFQMIGSEINAFSKPSHALNLIILIAISRQSDGEMVDKRHRRHPTRDWCHFGWAHVRNGSKPVLAVPSLDVRITAGSRLDPGSKARRRCAKRRHQSIRQFER